MLPKRLPRTGSTNAYTHTGCSEYDLGPRKHERTKTSGKASVVRDFAFSSFRSFVVILRTT